MLYGDIDYVAVNPWPFRIEFPLPEASGTDAVRRTVRVVPNFRSPLRLPPPSYFQGIYTPAATAAAAASSTSASLCLCVCIWWRCVAS